MCSKSCNMDLGEEVYDSILSLRGFRSRTVDIDSSWETKGGKKVLKHYVVGYSAFCTDLRPM